jgi:hypothetical protein
VIKKSTFDSDFMSLKRNEGTMHINSKADYLFN